MKTFFLLFSILFSLSSHALTIKLSESDIETRLKEYLPYDLNTPLFSATVNKAKVSFTKNTKRIQISLSIKLTTTSETFTGTTVLESGIRYDSKEGSFYLQDPQIIDLDIANLSLGLQLTAKELLNNVTRSYFNSIKVYQFDLSNSSERMTAFTLKEVSIHNNTLLLELDLF
jgi:hypothetical protein